MKKELRNTIERVFGRKNLFIADKCAWAITSKQIKTDAFDINCKLSNIDLFVLQIENGDSFIHFGDDRIFLVESSSLKSTGALIGFLKELEGQLERDKYFTIVSPGGKENLVNIISFRKNIVKETKDILYIKAKNAEIVLSASFHAYKEIFMRLIGREPSLEKLSFQSFKIENNTLYSSKWKYTLHGKRPFSFLKNEVPVGVCINYEALVGKTFGTFGSWNMRLIFKDKPIDRTEYIPSISLAETIGELKRQVIRFFGLDGKEGKKSLIENFLLEDGLSIYISYYGYNGLINEKSAYIADLPKKFNDDSLINDVFRDLLSSHYDLYYICDLSKEMVV